MIDKIKNWFREHFSRPNPPSTRDPRRTGNRAAPRPAPANAKVPRRKPEFVSADDGLSGTIESNGPGKNVLIRNKFVREDTGTHETLMILDDSIVDSGEEQGLDPYNTGGFDRSKNWERRFGK